MALEQVKARLLAITGQIKQTAMFVARIGADFNKHKSALERVKESIDRDLGIVRAAIADLNDYKAAVLAATAGHQVNAPGEVLAALHLAINGAEEMRDFIMSMKDKIEEAQHYTALVEDRATHAVLHSSMSTSLLDRYRTSF